MTTSINLADAPARGAAPASRVQAPSRRRLVIEPPGRWPVLDLCELWAYRGLFRFLVWRDIKIRYAQTVLGVGWAVLQPLLTVVVFTVIFGRFAGIPSDGAPYFAFALAALVPWTYFSTALTSAGNSLVANTRLITKVYFPRLAIPLAPVLAGLFDLAIAFAMLLGVLLAFGVVPSPLALAVLPLLALALLLTAAGVGCWVAALHIRYRDVKYVTPFLVQVWMFLSPIVYPASIVPERYRLLYSLNPLAGIIEGSRAVLLGTRAVPWAAVGLSLAVSSLFFVSGVLYFQRTESTFADIA